ncbi:Proteasome subunit beta type-4 [Saitozyma podzolica]|uniref:Proteasome subunit beta type-4 n=1 Tax=Saitozyma podzolica TaxID=1890683 RepID=A0A427XMJ0_9TREE|nr:Proteasome subunit beta type-4 [Saitozyma podzolica]
MRSDITVLSTICDVDPLLPATYTVLLPTASLLSPVLPPQPTPPPPSASAWVRRTLAESIRSRKPYAVNLLLAGYDISTSLSHLYWIDYLGTKAVVPYAAHGLGVYVALSTMDKWWYPDIQRREGVDVLKKCVNEVEKRLTVKFAFNCILIDKDGIHNIDLSLPDPIGAMEAAASASGTTTAAAEGSGTETVSAAPVSAA